MQKQHSKQITDYGSTTKEKKYLYGPVATVFASTKTGTWRVVRPKIDRDKCNLCGTCLKYCPTDVISIEKKGPGHGLEIDFDYCKGCGICATVCKKDCITMVSERGGNH